VRGMNIEQRNKEQGSGRGMKNMEQGGYKVPNRSILNKEFRSERQTWNIELRTCNMEVEPQTKSTTNINT
jgi:hypothetical protein